MKKIIVGLLFFVVLFAGCQMPNNTPDSGNNNSNEKGTHPIPRARHRECNSFIVMTSLPGRWEHILPISQRRKLRSHRESGDTPKVTQS